MESVFRISESLKGRLRQSNESCDFMLMFAPFDRKNAFIVSWEF